MSAEQCDIAKVEEPSVQVESNVNTNVDVECCVKEDINVKVIDDICVEEENEKEIEADVKLDAELELEKEPVTTQQSFEKIDVFENPYYIQCCEDVEKWNTEVGSYYKTILCCTPIKERKQGATLKSAYDNFKNFTTNTYEEFVAKTEQFLCILPIGHSGACCSKPHIKMFSGLKNKFDTGIYCTPGNDGYIFKNRHNRLFPIAIPDDFERKIKNKNVKLQCAIPLKDKSTPLMLASAYFDYLVFVSNVRDIHTIKVEHEYWNLYAPILASHKNKLIQYYGERNRKIFNQEGFTECSVNGYEFKIEDFVRDSRVAPLETDVQLGHCVSRKDTRYTIRGMNINVMTREGNRLVGDYDFFDDTWINNLKKVVSRFA